MHYDPIKDRLGIAFGHPKLLTILYRILHLVFLRAWYVRREIRRLPSRARVLDAGTGFGQYAWFVARKVPEVSVTAVDIKEDYLHRARKYFESAGLQETVTIRQDDLTDPKVSGPFTCILAVDVLEHLDEDELVMRHFARLLDVGGEVIISTPSDLGGSDASDTDEGFIGEHVRDGYSIGDIKTKLSNAGLEVVKAVYSYGVWGSLAWRLLVKYPMQLLGISMLFSPLLLIYYIPALPIGLMLNRLDMIGENPKGTGLLVVARKNTQAFTGKSLPL